MRAIKKVGVFDSKDTIAAKIPLNEMIIDEYQGHVHKTLVEKLVSKWDDSASGAVILNLREDNTYAVLDGQHRVLAARQVGVEELNALVFVGKTKEEEARLFVQLNTKHNVSALDRFRANLMSGAPREKTIRAAAREVGLEIPATHRRGVDQLVCVAALINVYENFGLPALKMTLGVLTSAFSAYPDRAKGYSQSAVLGTAQFLYRYPNANVPKLIERLRSKSPTVLTAMGEAKLDIHADLWTGWMKMLVSLYNTNLSQRTAAYLNPLIAEKKHYSPAAIARMQSPEQKAKRIANLAKVSEASRARRVATLQKVNEERALRREKEHKAKMTVGKQKPLTSTLAVAAKTAKGK